MSKSILIVDDEYGLSEVVADILTDEGFDVAMAMDGKRALATMAQQRPDLVLLDLVMPVVDGWTVLRAMRGDARLATVPVVLMTVLAESVGQRDKHLHQGVLFKPFTLPQLLETIRSTLPSETRGA